MILAKPLPVIKSTAYTVIHVHRQNGGASTVHSGSQQSPLFVQSSLSSCLFFHFIFLLHPSTIHAVLAVTFSSYSLAFGLLGTYRVFSKSSLGFVTLQVSLGYFVADLVIILLDPKLRSDKASLMHHIAGIVGLVLSLHFQGKLMYYLIFRLISELSTPFVNMRWVLYEFRITNGILYRAAAYGMMATFFFTRIITMPWFWYDFYYCFMHPGIVIVPDFFKVWAVCNFSAFDVLNLYWFYKMAAIVSEKNCFRNKE
ncbi:hypothetical protein EMCRGX_G034237 [Ephydatia muelleri]